MRLPAPLRLLAELAQFVRQEKKYWLMPLLLVMLLVSLVFLASQALPLVSPFLYTLF